MAVAIFMAKSASHPDPKKDAAGCHKVGDFITAFDDTRKLGRKVGPPIFARVQFPRVKAAVLKQRYRGAVVEATGDPENPYRPLKRHRWSLLKDELPTALKEKMFPVIAGHDPEAIQVRVRPMASVPGETDVTWEDLRQHMYDHAEKKREDRSFTEGDIQQIITIEKG